MVYEVYKFYKFDWVTTIFSKDDAHKFVDMGNGWYCYIGG